MAARLPPSMRLTRPRHLTVRCSVRHLQPFSPCLSIRATTHVHAQQPRPLQTSPHRHLTTTTRRLSPSSSSNNNNNGSPVSSLFSALPNLNFPFPTPGSGPPVPKTLRARRLLPYPPAHLYTIIADIDAYSAFLPHCTHSRVTQWTKTPAAASTPNPSSSHTETAQPRKPEDGQPARHPALADLTVGWGPFTQTYTSRVYCVPGSVVEAVSGRAETNIPAPTLRAAGYTTTVSANGPQGGSATKKHKAEQDKELEGGIFESLVTRWTVQPAPAAAASGPQEEWTEVTLSVSFQFANPALGFAVGQLADDKVGEMVEAFEKRAKELYGRR